jgi:mRNA-degrading endonuclease toxin of MazEF toxin-antitoxin module
MFGEIQLCRFPFTDGIGAKARPVLVLFDLGEDAVVCRITSRLRDDAMDVKVMDWRAAGLLKESTVRLDKLVTAEKSVFFKRLGQLSAADLEAVRSRWNNSMRL